MFATTTRHLSTLRVILAVLALALAFLPGGAVLGSASADDVEVEATSTEAVAEQEAAPAQEKAEIVPEPEPEVVPVQTTTAPVTEQSANTSGPYDSTSDGSPSGNGNGNDNGNRPCAGCVGEADDKNPPGQLPDADNDGDNGYECDGNNGVGKTNPAHSGCQTAPAAESPDIALEKGGPRMAHVGDVITYTFKVTNTGDTTLSDVHVTDPMLGGRIAVSPSTLPAGSSGVTVHATGSADYTVTADDAAGGSIHNVATAHGTSPSGADVTATDDHTVNIPRHTICHATGSATNPYVIISPHVAGVYHGHLGHDHQGGQDIIPPFEYKGTTYSQRWDAEGQAIFNAGCIVAEAPEIELAKAGPDQAAVGETITYTFDVVNTGNVTLTDVHITDPLIASGRQIAVTPATLAPEQHGTATAEYTVDEADLIDDVVHNVATVHGTSPAGEDVSATDDHDVDVPEIIPNPDPLIELEKDGPDVTHIGATITYTFDVVNTGDATLTNVHITDPLIAFGRQIAVTPSTLAPGQEGTASVEYTVQEADVVDMVIHNVATVHGTSALGQNVTDTDDHDVTVALIPPLNPSIELDKSGPDSAVEGEEITYTFRVTNTGEVTLTDVHILDPMLSTSSLPVTPTTLAPGAVGTATATYTVTAADAEAGEIYNTAVTKGTPPDGDAVTDDDDHTVEVPDAPPPPPPPPGPEPGITIEKTGPATAAVGQTITYRFLVTNSGETTLTNVTITDETLGLTDLAVTPSTLSPGQVGNASATYTITEADGDRGFVYNTAVVTGTPPDGPPVTDDDDHTTEVPPLDGPPEVPPAPPGDLPATGMDTPTQLLLAALALMLGTGMVLAGRSTGTAGVATAGFPARRLAGHESPPPVHRGGAGRRFA